MNPSTKKIDNLQAIVKLLRQVDNDLTLRDMSVFLFVAEHEGCTQSEIVIGTKINQGAMYRIVVKLADEHNGRKGLGLLSIDVGANYREQSIKLTPIGRKLLSNLEALV